MHHLQINCDTGTAEIWLATLTEAAEIFPEVGNALVDFLEAGEEIFSIHCDGRSAALTGEIVVCFDPSDGLLRLVSALRARDSDLRLFEHLPLPICEEQITGDEGKQ